MSFWFLDIEMYCNLIDIQQNLQGFHLKPATAAVLVVVSHLVTGYFFIFVAFINKYSLLS